MRSRTKITLRLIDGLAPEKADYFVWDSQVAGLGLRVRVTGHKSYVLQYRHEGRSRRYAIGQHGSPWTPETARSEAIRLLGSVAGKIDVQAEKIEKRMDLTVAELCDLYLVVGLATRKASSVEAARADIENHIKPILGARKAATLGRADIERLLLDVAAGFTTKTAKTRKKRGLSRVRGGKGAANSAVRTLSAAIGFGVGRGVRADNPAIGVRRFQERRIERFLSPAELVRLGEVLAATEAIGVESPYAIAAIRLLTLTGCRRNEILTLKRSYIDQANSCLRLPDSKTGAKVVQVGAAVLEVLRTIPPVDGNPYVMPGRNGLGHVVDLQAVWERVRKAAGLEDTRLHDLRHSFASFGAVSGDSLLIIGALLGHRSSKTTERYAHLTNQPVKHAAERISGQIAVLLDPGTASKEDGGVIKLLEAEPEEIAPISSILGDIVRTRWLDTRAAAVHLGMTVGTLQTYRWMGVGPPFQKIGRRVVYAAEVLDCWKAVAAEAAAAAQSPDRRVA
ncbi:tyrosine-type recombinase/integrase [Caulobacter sp. LARHSG274]